jgi:hypothetical protein
MTRLPKERFMSLSTWTSRGIVAGLTLVAALAIPVRSARAIDPKYLPADTEAVLTVNVKALLESDLAKAHKDLVAKGKAKLKEKVDQSPAKEYLEKAGFDVFKDLHSITIAGNGGKDTDKIFLVIEGNFDTDKILDVARDAGNEVKVGKVGNIPTLEISAGEDQKPIHAAILNDHVILAAGTRALLTEGIARSNSAKAAVKPALKTLLDSTKATQAFSMVITANGIANGLNDAPVGVPDGINQQLQAIDGLSMNLTVAKDVSFQVAANVKDNESASKMTKTLNFGLLAVRGMIGQKAENDEKAQLVLDLANTLRVAQQGLNVTLRGEISRENFDRILEMMPKKE